MPLPPFLLNFDFEIEYSKLEYNQQILQTMKPAKALLNLTLIVLFTPILVIAADQLGKLKMEFTPEGEGVNFIVRNPNAAVLVVHSTVHPLSFEANMGIIKVDNPDPGEYRVHLNPGTSIVTFKAEGCLPLKQMVYIEPKDFKEVEIGVLQRPGGMGKPVEEKAEIRLNYAPDSPDEAVYGGLDEMVMKIDFSKGYAVFNPSPGRHKIKLNAGGRVWEKTYDLRADDKIEADVSFAGGREEQIKIQDPGNLFITSEPSGAMVYLNKVEQDFTPLTLDDVQPGTYQIEVRKELYLPENRIVEIKSNSYSKERVELTPNYGRLEISSDPPGAMLWINNKNLGKTPYTAEQYTAGAYSFRMIREMYYDTSGTLKIEPGGEFVQTFKLKPQFGGARIDSDPSGAQVSIDGQPTGTTPVIREQLASGRHIVKFEKEYYFEYETSIEIEDGKTFEETFKLKPNFGLLSVESSPSGADVVLANENRAIGRTPLREYKLPAGTYTVKVEKDLYEPYEMPVSLMIDGERRLEPTLKRKTGRLRVKSDPPEADIYLDGKRRGQTPAMLTDVPTGECEIRIRKDGCDIHLGKVTVIHNELVEYETELGTEGTVEWEKRRGKARMLAIVPGAGQFASGQYVRGGLYAGAFLGSLAMTYLAHQNYSDAESDHETAMSDYLATKDQSEADRRYARYETTLKEMNDARDQTLMFSMIAGGIYAWQFIDAWIWGGGKKPVSREYGVKWKLEPYASTKFQKTKNRIKIVMAVPLSARFSAQRRPASTRDALVLETPNAR